MVASVEGKDERVWRRMSRGRETFECSRKEGPMET